MVTIIIIIIIINGDELHSTDVTLFKHQENNWLQSNSRQSVLMHRPAKEYVDTGHLM